MRDTRDALLRLIELQQISEGLLESEAADEQHAGAGGSWLRVRGGGSRSFVQSMVYLSTWFILACLLCVALLIGVLSLVLKLSMFGFIAHIDAVATWTPSQWLLLCLFLNQIWNIHDVDKLRIETLYKFLFVDHRAKYSRFVAQRCCMLDSVIKEELFRSHGYRGLLFAVCLNAEIVQKILIKPEYELSTAELIEYRQMLDSRRAKASVAQPLHNSWESEFEVHPSRLLEEEPKLDTIISGMIFGSELETGTGRGSRTYSVSLKTTLSERRKKPQTLGDYIEAVKQSLDVYERRIWRWMRFEAHIPPKHPYGLDYPDKYRAFRSKPYV